MQTVAVAMQKGGCGKSTLSRHGSVILPRTALMDLDPQGTTLRWLDKRREKGVKVPGAIKSSVKRAEEAMQRVQDHGGFNYLIIDTPPEHDDQRTIRFAIEASDFVLMPCKASPDDLEVLKDTIKLAHQYGKPFGVVLTMVRQGSRSLQQAQELLEPVCEKAGGWLCPASMGNRVDYVDAVYFSQTVTEYNKSGQAAQEMTQIWEWVGSKLEALKNG